MQRRKKDEGARHSWELIPVAGRIQMCRRQPEQAPMIMLTLQSENPENVFVLQGLMAGDGE